MFAPGEAVLSLRAATNFFRLITGGRGEYDRFRQIFSSLGEFAPSPIADRRSSEAVATEAEYLEALNVPP